MIAEKPGWVKHEGMQIFSIDIQPGSSRFATAGGDHKVRIWSMKPVSRKIVEPTKKLLATLRDHFGSVNCVRWAKHGRLVASGSDDQVIQIHERKPGSGTSEFGSGEPPDVENWKVVMTLRGHTADVVDLNWSPDDSMLASGSLDNTVHIWNMSNGMCTAVLRGHSSLVKGVTWDPIGSFVASQSDDKTVIIWRTSDWSLAHRADAHWTKSLGSTFFRRLGWSPCGHFLTTTHGFQKPRHSAPVLERGEWSATFDFLGHNAPIVVVKFNQSMFKRNSQSAEEVKSAPSEADDNELQPYNIIAIGSQDRTITVWTTSSPRPLFVAKHFFTQSVVDLTWSPDGYSLFACSLDGTIATFHFEEKEFGQRLNERELEDLKKNRYGDVRGRQANLAESPAQLLLEAASQTAIKMPIPDLPKNPASLKSSSKSDVATKSSEPRLDDGKEKEGPSNAVTKAPNMARITNPVKQREYRRPDGRKRIIPEAVRLPVEKENISGELNSQPLDFPLNPPVSSKHVNGVQALRKAVDVRESTGVTARAMVSDNLVIEKVLSSVNTDGAVSVEHSGVLKASGDVAASTLLTIRVFDKKEGEDNDTVCLEAQPREHAVNDIIVGAVSTSMVKETEIVCRRGAQTLWSDRVAGKATVLAGNANFWAVGCEDGCLQISNLYNSLDRKPMPVIIGLGVINQVYTRCGRRAMPTMMMGSSIVFIDCDECWRLLAVTRKGSLYVWDLFNKKCLLHDSLASLVAVDPKSTTKDAGIVKIISTKLSKSGFPLVVLATRHAFLYDMSLMCWLRVADDCFPASTFSSTSTLGSIHSGELAALQVDVRKYLARKPGWSRVTDDGVQTRAHLESQLASTLSLQSPNEYRQCLLSYVRFLAREADVSRLREVCDSFLGPPTGMAEDAPSESMNLSWDPYVLGMSKHKLLREDILPAMASNRKVQRLLNEFMDILSEYGSTENNPDPNKNSCPLKKALPTTQNDHTSLKADQPGSSDQVTVENFPSTGTEKVNYVPVGHKGVGAIVPDTNDTQFS